MFDPECFYAAANNGETTDVQSVIDHIKTFDHVVLWGAGNLGRAIGEYLLELRVHVSVYWDLKADQIKEINGIDVVKPFSGDFDKGRTVVIPCISNGSSGGEWTTCHLSQKGYVNFIRGMSIYQGLICPIDQNSALDPKVCLNANMCNVCACERFLNVLRVRKNAARPGDELARLDFNVVTFIISQKCSLRCKYCGQYMNNYSENERINFPLVGIIDDIDRFFEAADTIGVVSVIGGEPFLHPEISSIVKHILTKRNFGVINITTNGICKLSRSLLEGMKNHRVKVSFSSYIDGLSTSRKELFGKNVKFIESEGINYSIGVPVWGIPNTLKDKRHSVDTMINMKSSCTSIKMCMNVKNGRFYPCGTVESVHSLNVADYPSDYADIRNTASTAELRHRLRSVLDMACFQSCSHCGGDSGELFVQAGEQGTDKRYELTT
jgi:hypothetical protein